MFCFVEKNTYTYKTCPIHSPLTPDQPPFKGGRYRQVLFPHSFGLPMESAPTHVVNIESAITGEPITSLAMPPTATIRDVKRHIQGDVSASIYRQKLLVPPQDVVQGDDATLASFPSPLTLKLVFDVFSWNCFSSYLCCLFLSRFNAF